MLLKLNFKKTGIKLQCQKQFQVALYENEMLVPQNVITKLQSLNNT